MSGAQNALGSTHSAARNSVFARLWGWLCAQSRQSVTASGLTKTDRFLVRIVMGTWFARWLQKEDTLLAVWQGSAANRLVSDLYERMRSKAGSLPDAFRNAWQNSVFAKIMDNGVSFWGRAFSASVSVRIASGFLGFSGFGKLGLGGVMLSGFVFVLPFLPTVLNAALSFGLFFVWGFSKIIENKPGVRFFGAYVPGFLFFGSAVGATFGSLAMRASGSMLLLWASYAVLFFLASQWAERPADLRWVALSWVISALLVSAFGFLQFASGVETASSWIDARVAEDIRTRVHSVFDNPNMLAEYLTYAIALGGALWLSARSHSERIGYLAILGALGLCLILTYSRGGWVATAISLLLLGFLKDRRLVLVFIVLLLAAPLYAPEALLSRAATLVTLDDSSALYRITIWKATVAMIKERWLTGFGLGAVAFGSAYRLYEIAGTPAAHSHNLYLQIWAEMGIVALVLFLYTVFAHLRDAVSAKSDGGGLIVAALVVATIGQLVHGIIDNIWYSPKNVMFFWLALGLAVSARSTGTPKSARSEGVGC